jgi:hypothetical protein
MVNTTKSYIRLEKQSKGQLREMLAEAQRNTQPNKYPVAVKVPAKKRSLPTRTRRPARAD